MRSKIYACLCLCFTLAGVACNSGTSRDESNNGGESGSAGGGKDGGGAGGKAATGGSGGSSGGSGGQGGSANVAGSGGTASSGGMGGTAPINVAAPRVYDFEVDTQTWGLALESKDAPASSPDAGASDAGTVEPLKAPVQSTTKALTGTGSLRVDIEGVAGTKRQVFVGLQGTPSDIGFVRPITKVTYNLWAPTDSALSFVQAYVVGFGNETPGWKSVSKLPTPGAWTQYELIFPEPYPVSPYGMSVGFQLETKTAWSGAVYIDAVKVEFM